MSDDDSEPLPRFAADADPDKVRAMLEALDLADGLPMVAPTDARMAAMLAGAGDPARSLGFMPPLFGEITVEAVAYNCVLAGCVPAELPVVLTAAVACLADDFNLLGLLTTTGTPAVAVAVHGPVARQLGMNDGINCLGPGNRANAAIGRALALALRNIGGARAGTGDMATMGQPGKYGFAFAESAPDLMPDILPGLAARRGLAPDADAVTVLGVSGTVEVLPLDDRDSGEAILQPIAAAMIGAGAASGSGRARPPGEQVFLLPPEIAEGLRRHGWDLARIRQYLFDLRRIDIAGVATFEAAGPVASAPEAIHPILTGGPGVKMTYLPLWMGGTITQTRELIALEA